MPTDSLKDLAELFSRRFFLNALLPTFVFGSATAAVITHCAASLAGVAGWWSGLDAISKIAVVLLYVACTYFVATALASQWRGIFRLYEGYPLRRLSRRWGRDAPGTAAHQARQDRMLDPNRASITDGYYNYPPQDSDVKVLPTRLGNILLAGESYSMDRYGIDCLVFWPRLFPLLPESFRREYETTLINAEFPLVVSLQAAVASAISAIAVLLGHGSPELFAAVVLVGAVFAHGGYVAALSGGVELAEQQRTAFDLYRDRLLRRWPTVPDVRDENEAFDSIHSFVVSRLEPDWDRAQRRYLRRQRTRDALDQGER